MCRQDETREPREETVVRSSIMRSIRWHLRWSLLRTCVLQVSSSVFQIFGLDRSKRVSVGWHGRCLPWMRLIGSTTCLCVRSCRVTSDYFRANGFATFQEDKPGLDLARGTPDWSTTTCGRMTIRTMKAPGPTQQKPLSAPCRSCLMKSVLRFGLNAARVFNVPIPERYRAFTDVQAQLAG